MTILFLRLFRLFTLNIAFLVTLSSATFGQRSISIVSWNVQYFGAPYNSGPTDKDLQEANVLKVIRYLNADVYGLCEIIDTVRLRRIKDSLGSQFSFTIAPYSSNGGFGTLGWRQSQKLAFLYRTDVFKNARFRGMMMNSTAADFNWASGRFPFLMTADMLLNGKWEEVQLILIHAKSGTTETDYLKRKNGAQELKDTLDAFYSEKRVFIIGDYNDELHRTIAAVAENTSPYKMIVADSTDNDHYRSLTLQESYAGVQSMINFPNVIDHHLVSNEIYPYYVMQSARVRTDVTTVVPDFVTMRTTSDHYPVSSVYRTDILTSITTMDINRASFVYPIPFNSSLVFQAREQFLNASFSIIDMNGRVLYQKHNQTVHAGDQLTLLLPPLKSGSYYLVIQAATKRSCIPILHL
jgi:endonuclease/exonuclease/phosphatase family metal-dependent hydrolase